MADDVLLNKAATIERCIARIRDKFADDPLGFAADPDRQDVAILNLTRACEACIDMAQAVVRRERLGVPQSARDLFDLLHRSGVIEGGLAETLRRMVGFRNIAVHDYQSVQLPITIAIIERHLDDLLAFSRIMVQQPKKG